MTVECRLCVRPVAIRRWVMDLIFYCMCHNVGWKKWKGGSIVWLNGCIVSHTCGSIILHQDLWNKPLWKNLHDRYGFDLLSKDFYLTSVWLTFCTSYIKMKHTWTKKSFSFIIHVMMKVYIGPAKCLSLRPEISFMYKWYVLLFHHPLMHMEKSILFCNIAVEMLYTCIHTYV